MSELTSIFVTRETASQKKRSPGQTTAFAQTTSLGFKNVYFRRANVLTSEKAHFGSVIPQYGNCLCVADRYSDSWRIRITLTEKFQAKGVPG